MKFKELSEVTGLPVRELRYLMSLGVIPAGNGRGRFADAFDGTHVAAAERYSALASTGLNARQIAAISDHGGLQGVVFRTAAFELRVLPGARASDFEPASVRDFLKEARVALRAARPTATTSSCPPVSEVDDDEHPKRPRST